MAEGQLKGRVAGPARGEPTRNCRKGCWEARRIPDWERTTLRTWGRQAGTFDLAGPRCGSRSGTSAAD